MLPAYRLTVKAPRSQDPTEATTLTPIGGAPHSDPFVVASVQGVAGAKPYLDLPKGKQGAIDVLSKKVTIGALNLRLLDFPLTATQPPAQVWFTAFIGDANGRLRLKGCKGILEESLDGGATWATIFTGRIGDVGLDTKLWVALELRSIADDMTKQVFVGRPHSSITYAFQPALIPIGIPKSWGGMTLVSTGWKQLTGTIQASFGYGGLPAVRLTTGQDPWLELITVRANNVSKGLQRALVICTFTSGARSGQTQAFRSYLTSKAYDQFTDSGVRHFKASEFGPLEAIDPNDPLYGAAPVVTGGGSEVGTTLTCYVVPDGPPSADIPLFIDDVHPVQLWADILDGKFSLLNLDVSGYTNRPVAARDTTAFANLIADPSLGTMRCLITAAAITNAWIEQYICQPFNLSYRLDGQGRVVPVDLRITTAVSAAGAITDTDLGSTDTPQWQVQGAKAAFAANVTYYVDQQLPQNNIRASTDEMPDPSLALVQSQASNVVVVNPLAALRDAGDTIIDIDAIGIRLFEADLDTNTGTLASLPRIAKLNARLADMLAPFAGGAAILPLRVSRTSAAGIGALPGTYWTVTITTQPDPATNQRGGTRLMLCTSRTENGPYVDLEFLDVGANATALVPTVGVLALASGGLAIPFTLNANSDPVRVEYAITPAGTGARPAATDASWQAVLAPSGSALWSASATATVLVVPANVRLWVRIQSRPTGAKLQQPSAYAFPAGGSPAGSIDVTAITTPSAVTVTGISGNRATVTWVDGDVSKDVELFLTTGGVPGTWTDAMRIQPTLPPGTTTVQLHDLTPSTANYAVGVRHRDTLGGTSAFATQTFTTTGTPSQAPIPPPPGIGGGGSLGTGITATPTGGMPRSRPRTGISLLLYPADPSFSFDIQRAPDSGGAPNLGAIVTLPTVPATQKSYLDSLPLDGVTYWYQVRHSGHGDTASAFTDWVKSKAVMQPAQGPTASIAHPLNSLNRYRCRLKKSGFQSVATVTITALSFDLEDYDVGSLHDLVTNNSRIVVPVGGGGALWDFSGIVEFANAADTTQRQVSIYKNAAVLIDGSRVTAINGNSTIIPLAWHDVPADGDYYELVAWHNSAGAVNVSIGNTRFAAIASW